MVAFWNLIQDSPFSYNFTGDLRFARPPAIFCDSFAINRLFMCMQRDVFLGNGGQQVSGNGFGEGQTIG